ncbi:hypothetical protein HOY82DRAFT_534968 [Tuber indicum]|nr:hypothetical protein HOY82DRAFT_534968 [Tuber indicum]
MPTAPGSTTLMAKQGQIVGYTTLDSAQKMTLKEISQKMGVLVSTCSNIIQTAQARASENSKSDLCDDENLAPLRNSVKGANEALTKSQKEHLVETTLQDADHCRMTFAQLAQAGNYLNFFFFNLFTM